MSNPFVGQIIQGGWNFAPRGYHMCDGALLPIAQYSAVFSLLGTTYGGNGTTNFGLPNLYGRSMVGAGRSTTGTTYVIGEIAGVEQVQLGINNLPSHTHIATFTGGTSTLNASTTKATLQVPAAAGALGHSVDLASSGALPAIYCPAGTAATVPQVGVNVSGSVTNALTGNSVPVATMSPFQAVTVVIALSGIFPTRS
jgi:microcystin-dependent protein